uniref:Uncharacterized protein n=1 Tax=Pipistrellus kuhlii TaxID=59472 RepID=A0A7J7YY48_PIPKU|nr:hypothetical protein mPipKuh1_009810 [Pipistrellus kuhlii]
MGSPDRGPDVPPGLALRLLAQPALAAPLAGDAAASVPGRAVPGSVPTRLTNQQDAACLVQTAGSERVGTGVDGACLTCAVATGVFPPSQAGVAPWLSVDPGTRRPRFHSHQDTPRLADLTPSAGPAGDSQSMVIFSLSLPL